MNETNFDNNNSRQFSTMPPPPAPRAPIVQKRAPLPVGRKDYIFALLFLIGCVMAFDSGLFGGMRLGYTVSFWVLTIVYMFYCKARKVTLYSTLCIILALAQTLVYALYDDGFVNFGFFFFSIFLLAVAIMDRRQTHAYSTGSFRMFADVIEMVLIYPFQNIGITMRSLFAKRKEKRSGGVIVGILCAVPVILIVVPLLMRADAAFAEFFSFLNTANIIRFIFAVIFGCGLFVLLFSHAFGLLHATPKKSLKTLSVSRSLPTAALTAFLGSISFFYVLYLLSQLSYFFDPFIGKKPAKFEVWEYASRGFFEMCIICVINLTVLFFVILFSKRKEQGKIEGPIQWVSAFITAFSLLLIVTAFSKMVLYIRSYGFTRLRLMTSAFMVWLFSVFVVLLIRLFCKKIEYMKIIIVSCALIACLVGLSDLDSTIAGYNTYAYRHNILHQIDVDQLADLNDAAVPSLIELLDDKDKEVSFKAAEALYWRIDNEPKKFDIRGYNFTTYRAETLIRQNKDRIKTIYDAYENEQIANM